MKMELLEAIETEKSYIVIPFGWVEFLWTPEPLGILLVELEPGLHVNSDGGE